MLPILKHRCSSRVVALAALIPFGVASGGVLHEQAERAAQRNFAEYLDALRIPNIAAEPNDIRRNADFLLRAFERRGFQVRLISNPANRPLVLAELPVRPGLPTLLFYIHYDGQPVAPAEWSQSDPFTPVVRRRNAAGEWRDVGTDALQTRPLDPELRVFARSASDDKAPILMMLTAFDLLAAEAEAPAFNVNVMLDGEEEINSPSLAGTVASAPCALAADALVILDGPVHESNRTTVVFGNRGIVQAKLVIFGPRAPLHSGHYGNYAPNPALRLASLRPKGAFAVHRRIEILRHRRPWDRDRLSAGDWVAFDQRARYYAAAEAGSCESYLQRGTALYWPVIDGDYNPRAPGTPWPPQEVSHFLQLQTLAAVPPNYLLLLP